MSGSTLIFFLILSALQITLVEASSSGVCVLSFSDYNSSDYTYQSVGWCLGKCASFKYYALYDGKTCLCGNSEPSSDDVVDSSECDVACAGYNIQNCGGSNAYQVFAVGSAPLPDSVSSSSSEDSSSSSSTSSSTTSSSTTSTVASSNTQISSLSSTITSTPSRTQSTHIELTTSIETQSDGGTHYVTITNTSVATSVVDNTSNSDNSKKKLKLIGAIVGGVIGGIAALSLISVAIFLCLRNRAERYVGAEGDTKDLSDTNYNKGFSNPFEDPYGDIPGPIQNTNMNPSSQLHYDNSTNIEYGMTGDESPIAASRNPVDDDILVYEHPKQQKLAVVNPDHD